jgi:hypothetical protein
MATQVFGMPAGGGTGWLVLVVVLPLAVLVMVTALFWPRPLRVELTRDSLAIRGSIYGRVVPRTELKLDQARVVDLEAEPTLEPRLRTNGVGLPNYRVGWFRLRDWQKALCFLTTPQRVLYLPTTRNYALLLSLDDPSALLSALRSH